jgi:hypothetical protein
MYSYRTQENTRLHSRDQSAAILYIESRPLPSLPAFSVLCTFSKILVRATAAAAAAGITRSSQMSSSLPGHTDKKNQIFLIYKEIKSGTVAKSCMRKGFLIYEELRKYFIIYEEAASQI